MDPIVSDRLRSYLVVNDHFLRSMRSLRDRDRYGLLVFFVLLVEGDCWRVIAALGGQASLVPKSESFRRIP